MFAIVAITYVLCRPLMAKARYFNEAVSCFITISLGTKKPCVALNICDNVYNQINCLAEKRI